MLTKVHATCRKSPLNTLSAPLGVQSRRSPVLQRTVVRPRSSALSARAERVCWPSMRAFPPVALFLVLTASALKPRAYLVAVLARLQRLGVVGDTSFALRVRSEPTCNYWPLRVGRGGKSEDDGERCQCERDGRDGYDHPPHPQQATKSRLTSHIHSC
jgi:hypothetical protein